MRESGELLGCEISAGSRNKDRQVVLCAEKRLRQSEGTAAFFFSKVAKHGESPLIAVRGKRQIAQRPLLNGNPGTGSDKVPVSGFSRISLPRGFTGIFWVNSSCNVRRTVLQCRCSKLNIV